MATHHLYRGFYESLLAGEIDASSDTIKVMLVTSAYTPNQQAHRYLSSVTGEAEGIGYTAGGQELENTIVTANGLSVTVDADDTAWESSTVSGRYLVLYVEKDTPAESPLISCVDFEETVSTTSGTFQSVWNSLGILTLTAA